MPRKYRLQANHPVATAAGFRDWTGEDLEGPCADTFEAWTRWAELHLGFRVDTRPGRSRMIDGVPHFFPKKRIVGVHCIRVVEAPNPHGIGYMQGRGAA